ncbi:MAG: hypothetical protein IKP32_03530 [Clostridia bacterium]|nr:hypothetical protein [Clostridia bacterium]
MKNVEERLQSLPQIAESTGLQADEALKRKILRAAEGRQAARTFAWRRWAPVMCALVVLIGAISWGLPRWIGAQQPGEPQLTDAPLIQSMPAGAVVAGEKLALDVPQGSISIRSSSNPSWRSIWEKANGANFPLVAVNGRYYRLLTNPTSIPAGMLGARLGAVDRFTSEPALADGSGIVSNIVEAGQDVYAVSGMDGALAAAQVNGQMRVFQRVSFGDRALVGREALADTLKARAVVALELSGVGTVNDAATAQRLVDILTANAQYLRAGGSETNQSLLIQLNNGITLQMAVNGERLIACGTWACPEFFEAFQEALQ